MENDHSLNTQSQPKHIQSSLITIMQLRKNCDRSKLMKINLFNFMNPYDLANFQTVIFYKKYVCIFAGSCKSLQ